MIKTVIVIGAGASKEAGLPIGAELKNTIASSLNIRFEYGTELVAGDHRIVAALRKHVEATENSRDINPHLRAGWRIRDAMPQAISIDNFIDAHAGEKKIETCGKLAIVTAILDAERHSKMYVDPNTHRTTLQYNALEETWFNGFLQLLTENCRAPDLEKRLSSIALVVFNYDRCVEHFLYHGLQNYYGIDGDRAAALVQKIQIFHPYGSVGSLPWHKQPTSIDFGLDPNSTYRLQLAAQIRTFAEGTDPDSSDITAIRRYMRTAKRFIFLGFAFHRLNLELLWPTGAEVRLSPDKRCFATAFGMSQNDAQVIVSELEELAGVEAKNVVIRTDLTCTKLIRDYWRSLSLRT
jgi:hypothetical protein